MNTVSDLESLRRPDAERVETLGFHLWFGGSVKVSLRGRAGMAQEIRDALDRIRTSDRGGDGCLDVRVDGRSDGVACRWSVNDGGDSPELVVAALARDIAAISAIIAPPSPGAIRKARGDAEHPFAAAA